MILPPSLFFKSNPCLWIPPFLWEKSIPPSPETSLFAKISKTQSPKNGQMLKKCMGSCSCLTKLQHFYISCINYSSPTVFVILNMFHSHQSLKLTVVKPSKIITLVVNSSNPPFLFCWFSRGILKHSITFY